MTENSTTAVGLKANEGVAIPRKRVFSWVLWDWATQPYNSVILTFVFTALYLTSDSFIAPDLAALADEDICVFGECHNGGGRTEALGVGDDGGFSTLEYRDHGVGRAEVDAYCSCHELRFTFYC